MLWPALKKDADAQGETLIFVDESRFHLFSHHQKTFSPIGQTPVLKGKRGQSPRHRAIGAVSPEGRAYFSWSTDIVKSATSVRFLKTLFDLAQRQWTSRSRANRVRLMCTVI